MLTSFNTQQLSEQVIENQLPKAVADRGGVRGRRCNYGF